MLTTTRLLAALSLAALAAASPAGLRRLRSMGVAPRRLAAQRGDAFRVRCAEGAVLGPAGKLQGLNIARVSDGESVKAETLVAGSDGSNVQLTAFFTQWGDFDSFEMAQRLKPMLPKLEEAGVKVSAVGIGTMEGAKEFSELTGFPADKLFVDSGATCYKALGYAPGFGREGVTEGWWGNENVVKATESWSPYAKLMAMCAGVGSPGTLQEVFRGYLGDRDAPEIKERFPGVLPEPMTGLFGVLGEGYQRPFELATVRLLNMGNILTRWETLTPEDKDLILQRGGALITKDGEVVWEHRDQGILGYADVDELSKVAIAQASGTPASLPPSGGQTTA